MRSSGGFLVSNPEEDGKEVNVRVEGQITFERRGSDHGGCPTPVDGIAYVMEDRAKPLIESGAAVRVMESWCPWFEGYHLYYPSRRQPTPAFSLLVEALRYRAP